MTDNNTVDERPVVLKVDHVAKSFRLPTEQATGLKMAFLNWTKGIKGYTEQHVLRDINFEVRQGDFFGIVGRNGSGKSTLLKIISQIYTPEHGSVTVKGKLVPFIELGVGFNPELQVTPLFRESFYMICSEGSDYPELVNPHDLDMSQEINVSQRQEVQVWNDYWFGSDARPLLNTDTMQLADAWPPTRRVWAAAPAIAAEHMRRAGRAKICRLTDPPPERVSYLVTRRGEELSHAAPPPDRISYLIAPRAVELPREAALFLEDLRWELQQHPDVVIYF